MDQQCTQGHGRQRRGRGHEGIAGGWSGARTSGGQGNEGSLGARTATRALVGLGAYVAQDLRDSEGVTRPLLRRAALRMVASGKEPVRRLGGIYLRADPPALRELPPAPPFEQQQLPG